jgi:hypothetical protein
MNKAQKIRTVRLLIMSENLHGFVCRLFLLDLDFSRNTLKYKNSIANIIRICLIFIRFAIIKNDVLGRMQVRHHLIKIRIRIIQKTNNLYFDKRYYHC